MVWRLNSTIFWIDIFLRRHLKCTSSEGQGWTEHMSAIARKGESFFFKMPTRERRWWYVWETELRFPPKSRLCVMDDSVQWAGWASVGDVGDGHPHIPAHIHLGPGGEDKVQGRARTLKTRWYNTCWMCWRWHANLLLNRLSISYKQFCTYDEYSKVLITFNRLDQENCWILGLSTQGHKL